MLTITIPAIEMWDEKRQEFVNRKEQTLQLEHSLVSLSKWESKWCKAFLGREDKTDEEIRDYIRCMTMTQNVDSDVYNYLSDENYRQVNEYINAPMTATTFSKINPNKPNRGGPKVATAEVIDSWMISLQIPTEFRKWHLNKLIAQIRTCSELNQPGKKMSKTDIMKQNAALNAARRQKLNSKG